jgi:peptide/nickel transport system permease protein
MSRNALIYFVLRRLAALVALLVVLSFGVFALLYLSPGSVVDILVGPNARTPETVRRLRQDYHLDQPFLMQYWLWAKEAAQFHFGNSIQTSLAVTDEIKARLPVSLFLGAYAYVLTMGTGVALGMWAAFNQRTDGDRAVVAITIVGLSTPVFVAGIFLIYLFAIVLPWFPAAGRGSGFWDELWHLTLPAVSLAAVSAAYVVKHTRAAMINVLDQDYVMFGRARGLSTTRTLFVYALRNALIPIVTVSALVLTFVITGAVLVEVTFSLQGVGSLLVQAADAKDLPMVQGVAISIAIVIMVANLLADLAYAALDPRIRLGRSTP